MERIFAGECWRELAVIWQLPTTRCSTTSFSSDYDQVHTFLYLVWKRTVCKNKSYIRTRVADDLRQYTRELSKDKKNTYRYVWEAVSYISDDKEIIKLMLALLPYMWY